jgi:hypothetical protein
MATTTGPVNGAKPSTSFIVGGVYNSISPVIPDGSACAFQFDVNGNLKISGGGSGSNAAAGPTGSAVPLSADFIGFQVGANLVGVSATNPLPITGSISATNPSVAATGGAPPASATYAGGNKSGVFTGFLIDAAGNLQTVVSEALPAGTNVIGHVITDTGSTTAVTGTVAVAGGKTNNNAAPDGANVGALVALANAASPSWTEGDLVLESVDLSGRQRIRGTLTNNNAAPAADGQMALSAIANAVAPSWTEGDLVLESVDLSGSHRIIGTRTNNANPPSFNVGVLPALANAAAPSWTEGDQVLESVDLAGNQRVKLTAQTALDTTTVPSTMVLVGGESNDATAQFNPIPLGAAGRSVIIEGVASGTAVPISGSITAAGSLTNNNAAPSTNNQGVLPAIANVADPAWTEGDQVLLSETLGGKLRVTNEPHSQGGLLIKSASGLTNTAVAIKASAGQIYGWFLDNTENTATTFFQIYNIASGSVTVGTSTPVMSFAVPGGGSANVMNAMGIAFGTAISIAATTGYSNGTAPANTVTFNVFYF